MTGWMNFQVEKESLARLGFGYDVDDIQGMMFRYDMNFEGIKTWRDSIGSMNLEGGVISTALGRTLKVSNDVKVNSLYNYPVQGTAADGFKLALINLESLSDNPLTLERRLGSRIGDKKPQKISSNY